MQKWIKQNPLLFRIICFVVLFHAVGIFVLSWTFQSEALLSAKEKQLVVKTIKLTPPKQVKGDEKIVAEAPPPPSKKKNTASPTKPPPPSPPPPPKQSPPAPKAKPKTKEKPQAKKVDDKRKKLLKQAQETLAKIEQRSDKIAANPAKTIAVPRHIDTLSTVGIKGSGKGESSQQAAYRVELATHLRALLQLPEMGNVEIKLIVDQLGTVKTVTIVSSESERNSDYVKKTLPTLSLPPFGTYYNGEKLHTFHITLTNE